MSVRGKKEGFTLVELILVVSLTFIVGVSMYPVGVNFYRTQVLDDTASLLTSVLRKTEAKSRTAKNDSAYGVRFLSDSYVLFEGDSYETRNETADEVFIVSDTISVTAPDELVFARDTGTPTPTATVVLSYNSTQETIAINEYGVVSR